MPRLLILRLAILGALSVTCIMIMQGYWLRRSYNLKDSEFHQTVTIALQNVANEIARFNNSELPKHDLIQRQSSNYYAVNVNGAIDANVLEDYLIREFEIRALNTDFEYAVYDCFSKELVYGNYCKITDLKETKSVRGQLPKFDDLTYYFVVRFPSRTGFLLSGMWQNLLFSLAALLSLAFFIYAMWVILQQRKLSELQKDFINNMTHEFKTPISSIKIASDYLVRNDLVNTDQRLKKYSEIIADQNERLNNQVEKVLNLARLEKDSFKLKKEIFDINPVLDDIVHSENLRIQESGHGIIKSDLASGQIMISGDKLHFSNVVYNIIDNAIKYCKKIPELKIKAYLKDKKVILDFIDNGIGIKQEEIERLFQKFYRVSTGNLHDVKGFGLGLFYVRNICKAHGWEIQVYSDMGKGSTFRLKIPILNEG